MAVQTTNLLLSINLLQKSNLLQQINDLIVPTQVLPGNPFTFTPATGVYSTSPVVTVSSSNSGTIYYTEDGSTPTDLSPVYGAEESSFASSPIPTGTTGGPYVVGFTFILTHAITISQLGRKYLSGNTHNAKINVWVSSNTVTPLATATVLASSSSDSNGFKWVTLGTPLTLLPGIEYAVALDTVSGGDSWGAAYAPSLNAYFENIVAAYSLSGNDIYPASVGITGDIYDSPAMMFTPALAIVQSETINALQGSNYGSAVYQAIPSGINAYGDSITVGFGLPSPSTQNWAAQFTALEDLTLSNLAVSGDRLCDAGGIPNAYTMYPSGQVGSVFLLGANDVADGDTATSTNLPILVAGYMAFAVWLGLADSLKIRSSGLAYSGTWASSTVFGLVGKASSTTGNTVTGVVEGSTIYVAGAVQGSNVNTMTITVDGVLQLTQNLSDPLSGTAATAWPFCYRVAGLSAGSHTVIVGITGAAGSGTVYIQWMAGNGVNLTTPFPYVGLGDTLPQNDSATLPQIVSYNSQQETMISELQSDGLNVQYINDYSVLTLGNTDYQTDTSPPNLHPTLLGATLIADYWQSQYSGGEA